MKKRNIIILIFLFLSFILTNVSNFNRYLNNYTSTNNDTTKNLEEINNLEPSVIDCQPLKFEWVKYWSSSGDHDRCFGSYMDSNDNIYLTGYQNFGSGDLRLVLVKYDKDGNLLFTSNWGTSGNDQHTGYDVVLDSLGNIYCAGIWRKDPDDWNEDFILLKFDSSGNHLWTRQWGGGGKEKCYAVACDSQDNLYLTGSTTAYEGEVVTLKYDSAGNLIWVRYWGGTYHESGFALTIDSSDNIYVGGYTYTTDASNEMVVIKYDSDGNELLNFTWGTPRVDWGYAVEFDSENNFYLAGKADNNVCLIKYNSTLDYQWHTTEAGSGDPKNIDFDSNDDIYLGGYTSGFGAYYSDFYLLKYDSSGEFHYRQLRNQAVDYAYAVHLDSNDDIYLTGSTYSGTTYSRMMMVKYTEPPCITIISPEPYSIFNNTAPEFNVSIYEPHLDMLWYSLNNGQNHTFSGNIGTISQTAWDLIEDGTVTIRFYANDSIGKLGSNLIYLWKDSSYPESATPDLSYLICWDENGVPISTAEQRQSHVRICSDENGGAIITWHDDRRGSEQDIYAQKVNVTGDIQWTVDGLVICYMSYSDEAYNPEICSDGKGGAIITWEDYRDSGYGVYAQKIDTNGTVKWIQNGVAIRTQSNFGDPKICSDSRGGAFITWYEYSSDRIYAQYINTNGNLQWDSSGIAMSSGGADDEYDMCSDLEGGIIVTWRTNGGDIYAQKISSSGSKLWGSNGVGISQTPEDNFYPKICHDGNGGAIITWGVYDGSERNIYAQRVSSTGTVQWKTDGLPICTAPGTQNLQQIVYDGNGGAIITWPDSRNGNNDIYAQRVNSEGKILWLYDGFAICTAQGNQITPQICSDGENGAIITWTDSRNGNSDVYAQRVNKIGYTQWKPNGVVICNETNNQNQPQICNYSNNGAIIVWEDYRNSAYCDVYTQKIRKDNPEMFIEEPNSDQIYGYNSPDFKLYIDEKNINSTWYCLNDGSNYTFTGISGKINQEEWDVYENGTVSITFYVNNSLGKVGKKQVIIRKDIINPTITILSPTAYDLFGNSTINYELSIEEPNLDKTWYTLNGGIPYFITGLSGTLSQEAWDACGNGTVSIRFYANDSVGNWALKVVIVRKDTHFPLIVINSPTPFQLCENATIDFEISIDEPNLDETWYTLNGGPPYFFTGITGTISQEAWDACGNGTVSIIFYANNTAGNTIFEEVIVRKNIYFSIINIISPVPNQIFGNATVDFEISIDDPNLDKTWYTLNGGIPYFISGLIGTINQEAWDGCENGTVTIIFYANNTVGNTAFKEIIIRKDIINPTITILSPTAYDLFGNSTINYELSIEEPNLDKTWYTLNGGIPYFIIGLSGTLSQEAWDACGNGTVSIRFYANDSVGNWALKVVIVRKDTHFPLIVINSPTPFQLCGNATIDFEISIDEPNLDKTWYSLNDGITYTFSGTSGTIKQIAWDACGNGTVTIRFFANDTVGYLTFKEIVVRKDSKIPEIGIISPTPYQLFGNTTFNFELSIIEGNLNTVWYSLNGGITYTFSGISETINQTAWDACGNGTVTIRFFANDTVGNTAYKTVIIRKDTSFPNISIISPMPYKIIGNTAFDFKLIITEENLNTTWYSLNSGINFTFSGQSGKIDQSAWNVCENGTVTIRFYANNTAGNVVSKDVIVWKYIYEPTISFEATKSYVNTTKPEYFHKGLLIKCTVNDNINISWVFFCENGTGQYNNRSMINLGNGNWTYILEISSLNWGNQLSFLFFANNSVGNIAINDNSSFLFTINIYDLQNPSTEIYFIPHSEEIKVNKSTIFTLNASDGYGSGISMIRYKINDSDWIIYNGSFDLSAHIYGDYLILFYAIDMVGNTEEIKTLLVTLVDIDTGIDGGDDEDDNGGDNENSGMIIPGYYLILLISIISLISAILIKKKYKFKN